MKKAVIIGASSGIGRELALALAKQNYEVGLMARRVDLLNSLQQEIVTNTHVMQLDVSNCSHAIDAVQAMIKTMNGLDLIIINAGVGFINPDLDWGKEKETIEVNVSGFCAIAGLAFKHFSQQGSGHIVGISSIGALRGNGYAPAYNASKAFMSNYLEGLRIKAFKDNLNITITDIKPGFVDTDMAKGDKKFWVAPPRIAAEQILIAINAKSKETYVTRRWKLIGLLLKILPEWLYARL